MAFQPSSIVVASDSAISRRNIWILHGIMGSRRNWRGFARRVVEAAPGCAVRLIDLRNHGVSRGAPPPHDLRSTAGDLAVLARGVGPPDALIGHSFGGKVAALYAREGAPIALENLAILDCPLAAMPPTATASSEVARVLDAVAAVELPIRRRSDVVAALRSAGFSESLAGWMATNVERREHDGGHYWRFDVDAVREMVRDYWTHDLTDLLSNPPDGMRIRVIRAGKDDGRWSRPEIRLVDDQAARGAIDAVVLPRAGHWLHVDDPEGLLAALMPVLRPDL